MTHFDRKGHFRKIKSGSYIWVRKHTVLKLKKKNFIYSKKPQYQNIFLIFLNYLKSFKINKIIGNEAIPLNIWSNYLLKHNALCPICKKPVFFYRNEHGSAVFFDELGPPWPKHPCTINENKKIIYSKKNFLCNEPVWKREGWINYILVKFKKLDKDSIGFSGYVDGRNFQFIAKNMPADKWDQFDHSNKYYWHFKWTNEEKTKAIISTYISTEKHIEVNGEIFNSY